MDRVYPRTEARRTEARRRVEQGSGTSRKCEKRLGTQLPGAERGVGSMHFRPLRLRTASHIAAEGLEGPFGRYFLESLPSYCRTALIDATTSSLLALSASRSALDLMVTRSNDSPEVVTAAR